ncbi:phage tail assembly protein T [Bordetella bronchiseptica]
MSEREFRSWQQFYDESPFDDLHRYHRPAAMLAQVQVGGDFTARLRWLADGVDPGPEQSELGALRMSDQFSAADLRTFEALGMRLS